MQPQGRKDGRERGGQHERGTHLLRYDYETLWWWRPTRPSQGITQVQKSQLFKSVTAVRIQDKHPHAHPIQYDGL